MCHQPRQYDGGVEKRSLPYKFPFRKCNNWKDTVVNDPYHFHKLLDQNIEDNNRENSL